MPNGGNIFDESDCGGGAGGQDFARNACMAGPASITDKGKEITPKCSARPHVSFEPRPRDDGKSSTLSNEETINTAACR